MFKTSMISKSTILATIVALALASVSATSVFAASTISAGTKATPNATATGQNLTSDWKAEMQTLHEAEFTLGLISKWHLNWLKTGVNISATDKTLAEKYMSTYASDLSTANSLAASHVGFSNTGVAIDNVKAKQSVDTLSTQLHDLHAMLIAKILSLFG